MTHLEYPFYEAAKLAHQDGRGEFLRGAHCAGRDGGGGWFGMKGDFVNCGRLDWY